MPRLSGFFFSNSNHSFLLLLASRLHAGFVVSLRILPSQRQVGCSGSQLIHVLLLPVDLLLHALHLVLQGFNRTLNTSGSLCPPGRLLRFILKSLLPACFLLLLPLDLFKDQRQLALESLHALAGLGQILVLGLHSALQLTTTGFSSLDARSFCCCQLLLSPGVRLLRSCHGCLPLLRLLGGLQLSLKLLLLLLLLAQLSILFRNLPRNCFSRPGL
mmetsp:Transcript_61931/g.165939  ORF Transcript_61931/g.165939 Transcript_61931/m.165939 type:complete len:216 (+) Transcript_61931:87-734(+)